MRLRWPPALPPVTPILSGSMPYFAALARMNRTARFRSTTISAMLKRGCVPWTTTNVV